MFARPYFIRPAAVSARVITALTSIAGRCAGRRGLARPGDTANGQGIALISGGGGANSGAMVIVVNAASATGCKASFG